MDVRVGTIKKGEGQRNDAFELWCWRRLLRVLWRARRSNQCILKEVSPEYSLKDWSSSSSNTLTTWWNELTHWKRPWCWERLKAGGEGDDRGWDGWMASPTQWMWVWVNSGSWWWTGRPGVLLFLGLQRVGHDWGTEDGLSCTLPFWPLGSTAGFSEACSFRYFLFCFCCFLVCFWICNTSLVQHSSCRKVYTIISHCVFFWWQPLFPISCVSFHLIISQKYSTVHLLKVCSWSATPESSLTRSQMTMLKCERQCSAAFRL